jgi:hypothetical protein
MHIGDIKDILLLLKIVFPVLSFFDHYLYSTTVYVYFSVFAGPLELWTSLDLLSPCIQSMLSLPKN